MSVILRSIAVSILHSAFSLSCIDESGAKVDWWLMLKHPVNSGGDDSGTGYVFVTSKDTSSLVPGSQKVTSADSLIGKQLADIYSGSAKNYVFYNDQKPDGEWTLQYGHSKGFFAYDDDSAFWVQHSIPHFPNYVKDGYLYGHGQEKNGQHAFCMTMTPQNINDVAEVMKYSNGWIYDHKTDGSLSNVEDIVEGKNVSTATSTEIEVTTAWGAVKIFGKTQSFDGSMLPVVVAPALQQTMFYQSWLNSGGPLGPYCPHSGYDVLDIKSIQLARDDTHSTKEDHSKWAVAKDPSSSWFCGVDNNHVESQLKRSGLAACVQIAALSSLVRAAAVEVDSCQSPSPSPPPPPGPPSPPGPHSQCCHYKDAADACQEGEICCSESGTSYKSKSTCSRYGAKHNCKWTNGTCTVGNAGLLV